MLFCPQNIDFIQINVNFPCKKKFVIIWKIEKYEKVIIFLKI